MDVDVRDFASLYVRVRSSPGVILSQPVVYLKFAFAAKYLAES